MRQIIKYSISAINLCKMNDLIKNCRYATSNLSKLLK